MSSPEVIVWQVAEGLVGLASAAGNLLVLYVIFHHKSLHKPTNYFISSLAAADLLVGIIGIPCVIVTNFKLPHNFYGCLIMSCMIVILTQISIFSLLAIAIERFLAVRYPVFHRQRVSSKFVATIIVICWTCGTLVGLMPVFGWNSGPPVREVCDFVWVMDMKYLVYIFFFSCFLCPLLIIYGTYCYIFYVIYKKHLASKSRNSIDSISSNNSKSRVKKESRAAVKIFLVIIVFTACWLPIHLMNALTLYLEIANSHVVICAILLSHANSAINPFLYAHVNLKFREAFKRTLGIKSNYVATLDQSMRERQTVGQSSH